MASFVPSPDDRCRTFVALARKVDAACKTLSKQEQLRVQRWLDKLDTSDCGPPTWLRDRNEYVRLLLYMVTVTQRLSEPFHVSPPDGMVPMFPKHLSVRHLRRPSPSRVHGLATAPRPTPDWKHIHRNLPLPITSASPPRGRQEHSPAAAATVRYRSNSSTGSSHSTNHARRSYAYSSSDDRIRRLEEELRNEKVLHSLHVQKIAAAHIAELSAVGYALHSQDYSRDSHTSAPPFFGANASPARRDYDYTAGDVHVPSSSSYAATELIAATGIDEALARLQDLDIGLAELSDDIASGGVGSSSNSPHVSFASPVRVGSRAAGGGGGGDRTPVRTPQPLPAPSPSPYRSNSSNVVAVHDDGSKQYIPSSARAHASDDEFLAYVSEFQEELTSLQRASPTKSAIVRAYQTNNGM